MTANPGIRDRPGVFRLSVRTEDRGGDVAARVRDPDRLRQSRCRHLLVLVHGFNNTADEADESYSMQISMLLSALQDSGIAPDAIAKLFWPGDTAVLPFRFSALDAVGYPADLDQARESARVLAEYLQDFPAAGGTESLRLSLLGHSLGCRLILEAIKRLPAAAPRIEVVSLMAAAVPRDLVESAKSLEPKLGRARRILKFFSEQDGVLQFAFPAGQFAAATGGIEPDVFTEAVGRFGNPGTLGRAERTANAHNQYWDDERVALIFLSEIDPKLRTMESGERSVPRSLPQATTPGLRALLVRSLPF